MKPRILDCTFRDGGYYNGWDFSEALIADYMHAMDAIMVDIVEIGFRSLKNTGFRGGCAYSTDEFINRIPIPKGLNNKIGVMINGNEISDSLNQKENLKKLFKSKECSPVTLVRIACHVHEFVNCLPAASWLKDQGYRVGFNLMQVADLPADEVTKLAKAASDYPIDCLYFADSMGSLNPEQVSEIVSALQKEGDRELGIHTHDSMGNAIANSIQAIKSGVTWIDGTVTGMGRGPGNAQTEYLILALEKFRNIQGNPTKLFELIRKHFKPMQHHYGWGMNPFYYLAGEYGIHPSYIQEMLQDSRYSEEDIFAVIERLKTQGAKKFNVDTLESARQFYSGEPRGTWQPKALLKDKSVLVLGAGPAVKNYKTAIEGFIRKQNPYVIALNTQTAIDGSLIDASAACHPVRLLADCHEHLKHSHPLITPASMLPNDIRSELTEKTLLDFGIAVTKNEFKYYDTHCALPNDLVVAYVLAIASAGQAKSIYLAGFDGYDADDPRRKEMDTLFSQYKSTPGSIDLIAITPTRYEIPVRSVFGLIQ